MRLFGFGEYPKADIAGPYYQSQQIKDMKWVLIAAIVGGTLLMMVAVILPYIVVGLLSATGNTQNGELDTQANQDTIEAFTSVPRDVLPFATALAGFAGGVVTAMFRTSMEPTKAGQPTPGQPTPGQPTPGQPTPGQPTPGQPTPGQPTPGQPTPGQGGAPVQRHTGQY